MNDSTLSHFENRNAGRSGFNQWYQRSPPNAVIVLDTPLNKFALSRMPKAPARVQQALTAAGWDGRWNRDLFRQIAAELNLPLPSVERHAEALQSVFRTAAAAAPTPTEERTMMDAKTAPSPPAYQKPDKLSELQDEIWDELIRRQLPVDQRVQWKLADELAKLLKCSATSVWSAQEAFCKKLGIELKKNPGKSTEAIEQPIPTDPAAASAAPKGSGELASAYATESACTTMEASVPVAQVGVDLQASLAAILARADVNAEIERGGLFGGLEALVKRDDDTRRELAYWQKQASDRESARAGLEMELTALRASVAEATRIATQNLQDASDCSLINGVSVLQETLRVLNTKYHKALADREQLLGEVARAHEELDVADIVQSAPRMISPMGDPERLTLPDCLTLAARINLLAAREAAAQVPTPDVAAAPLVDVRTLVISSLVTLADRESVHRAADLLERAVIQ